MRKVFLILMLGSPFPWIQEYIDNVQHLEQYGWYWKIFTPNPIQSKGNVEIVPFDTKEFNKLVKKKLGIKTDLAITETGVPSYHVTDYIIAHGAIFEDFTEGFDFWGHVGLDDIFGRLDHFITDEMLEECDVWTDDVNTINGNFCLFRNTPEVNNLFKEIDNWENMLVQPPCPRCTGTGGNHTLHGTDEYYMTEVMKREDILKKVRYAYPQYYPLHSHDRMEQHVPNIRLEIKKNGSLWELLKDSNPPNWIHARPFLGKEIPYFHFMTSKRWPL